MKVTLNFLKEQDACKLGIVKFKKVFGKSAELRDVINYGIKSKDKELLEYCTWLITRKMTSRERSQYAIYAAEQVITIYEESYPDDDRPRKAIEAAKKVLKKNSIENKNAASYAAFYASDAATYVAAWIKLESKILRYGLKILKGGINVKSL